MATEKITVALAPEVARRAKKAVKQGRAKSLSALVNGLLDERLRRDELDEVLAQMDAEHGPVDEETRAWARSVLSS
jgi:Arc/MetJ-type ribon-helix-helix transcriptional regulator